MKRRTAKAKGRPREFDRDEAVETALQLFCQYGYEGVSIADLTKAMHIAPTSLYAAFGNKEELYREVLDRYQKRPGLGLLSDFAKDGPIIDRLEIFMRDTVRAATCPEYPAGCMVSTGMLYCGATHEALAKTLRDLRSARCHVILQRLKRAASQGELPKNTDAASLSRYLLSLMQGIAIQARDGASVHALYGIVEIAMKHFSQLVDQGRSSEPTHHFQAETEKKA